MKNAKWWVQHNLLVYEKHPRRIGRNAKKDAKSPDGYKPEDTRILKIQKGDEIIYYATEDQVIVGVFRVTSNPKLLKKPPNKREPDWKDVYSMNIKPEDGYLARPPYYVYYYDMQEELKSSLRKFFKVRRRNVAHRLDEKEFDEIKKYVKRYIRQNHDLKPPYITPKSKRKSNEAENGEPTKLKFMRHAPITEDGVVALFAHYMNQLGFLELVFIRKEFPDAYALDNNGDGKYIEFELNSSGYVEHLRNPDHNKFRCDYVVCWEHDCRTIEDDVEVIELSTKLA